MALNGASAMMSGAAVAFFVLSCRKAGLRGYLLPAVALAFLPVVYIASTSAIDYVWALSFGMAALCFSICQRPVVAGMLLGMAIGCRITSVLLLVPYGYLLFTPQTGWRGRRVLTQFAVPALLVGGLWYLPACVTYGPGFLHFFRPARPPTPLEILKTMTTGVFGRVGSAALGIATVSFFLRQPLSTLRRRISQIAADPLVVASLLACTLQVAAFLRLPLEPGYLMPALPFLLIILIKALGRRALGLVSVLMALSSFVTIGAKGIDPGPILSDYADRKVWMQFTDYVVSVVDTLPTQSIIVSGDWLPKLRARVLPPTPIDSDPRFVQSLSEAEARRYLDAGYSIYYLPDQRIALGIGEKTDARISPLVADSLAETYRFMTGQSHR